MTVSSSFLSHNEAFDRVIGANPTLELIAENEAYPFAHEAGVYVPLSNTWFITSNRFTNSETGQQESHNNKSVVGRCRQGGYGNMRGDKHHSNRDPMAIGGINYRGGILICAQGSMNSPSSLYHMSSQPPYSTTLMKSDFYGRSFNSVNNVVIHSDGSIWFTDPIYGFEQGYRPASRLPNQIYRFNPADGSIRATADGFGRPNFSPDEKQIHVTDTDWIHGDGTTNNTRASSIYAFEVTVYHNQPFLTGRRLFAMADTTIPDGIKCDPAGNVYSGCGDGVNVWSPGGVLLCRILVEGGVANFCWGRDGEMFLMNEHRLYRAKLTGEDTKGAVIGV